MKRWKGIIFALFIIFIVYLFTYDNDTRYKNYIIGHSNEITVNDYNVYRLKTTPNNYYTDITIKMLSDSSYSVVVWGDRDSWLWDYKTDKYFTIDISYNRYKGINVEKDIKILEIINNIK